MVSDICALFFTEWRSRGFMHIFNPYPSRKRLEISGDQLTLPE